MGCSTDCCTNLLLDKIQMHSILFRHNISNISSNSFSRAPFFSSMFLVRLVIFKYLERLNDDNLTGAQHISISFCMYIHNWRGRAFTRFVFTPSQRHKITFKMIFSDIPGGSCIDQQRSSCPYRQRSQGNPTESREKRSRYARWQKFCSNTLRDVLLRRRCTCTCIRPRERVHLCKQVRSGPALPICPRLCSPKSC